MSSNAERLAAAVIARRKDLAVNQLEVSHQGGPSNTLLTTIENGRLTDLTNSTAKKLDTGLRWVGGSARRLWDKGEEPLPLPPNIDGLRREDVRHLAETIRQTRLDDQTKAELLRVLKEGDAV